MVKLKLDDGSKFIIGRLTAAGYKAYAVGGCIRDLLSGKNPEDFDLASSALPQQTIELFSDFPIIKTGLKHGTITVAINGENYEITTFRRDGNYPDGRRPDRVDFVSDITEDLSRRDFTVNAMAYNDKDGLIDPFGGEKDIGNKMLKCVGDPEKRFTEDSLRILRLVRFSSTLGYRVEKNTAEYAKLLALGLKNVSCERIFAELNKMLAGKNVVAALLNFKSVIFEIFPELRISDGFSQKTPWHKYDVYGHIARSVGYAKVDESERWCMLLHDIAKPETFSFSDGKGHFYGHAKRSAVIAEDIFDRLKFPTMLRKETSFLIANHGYVLKNDEKTIKRLLSKWGDRAFFKLLDVHRADNLAQGTRFSETERKTLDEVEITAKRIIERGDCYKLSQLEVGGTEVAAAGFKGERIGEILDSLLSEVISGKLANDKAAILRRLKELK